MHDLSRLLAAAAKQNIMVYRGVRGIIAWRDTGYDRASAALCKSLEAHAEQVKELLLRSGWWECDCPRCAEFAGTH